MLLVTIVLCLVTWAVRTLNFSLFAFVLPIVFFLEFLLPCLESLNVNSWITLPRELVTLAEKIFDFDFISYAIDTSLGFLVQGLSILA